MTILRARATNSTETDQQLQNELQNFVCKPGDLIVVHENYTSLSTVKLRRNAFLDNRYGRFSHDDILGRPLGRRWHAVRSLSNKSAAPAGFIHALAPTPELMSQAMVHRTQIVYPHDTAIISTFLELAPGSVLVECGTGSASASTAFARVVAPHGRIISFEFHQLRANGAIEHLDALNLSHIVSVTGGVDVTKSGFIGVEDHVADAVFLDLPAPYLMSKEVRRVLKPNGAVCTFSPCIEQVGKTCKVLREGGFHSIRTITAPMKTYETREQMLDTPGFDHCSSDEEEIDSLNIAARVRKRRRMATKCNENSSDFIGSANENTMGVVTEKQLKRKSCTLAAERQLVSAMRNGKHIGRVIRAKVALHSRPFSIMKGHTSYLTFARKSSHFIDECLSSEDEIVWESVQKKEGGTDDEMEKKQCVVS